MADVPTTYFSLNRTSAAVFQGGIQYSTGVAAGYLIDQVFTLIDTKWDPEGTAWKKAVLMLAQAGVTGLSLSFILPYIHDNGTSAVSYRDPTGGYLMAMGLFHGQPKFSQRSKLLVGGLIEKVEEISNPNVAVLQE